MRAEWVDVAGFRATHHELGIELTRIEGGTALVARSTRDGEEPYRAFAGALRLLALMANDEFEGLAEGPATCTLTRERAFGAVALDRVDEAGHGQAMVFSVEAEWLERVEPGRGGWRNQLLEVAVVGPAGAIAFNTYGRIEPDGRFREAGNEDFLAAASAFVGRRPAGAPAEGPAGSEAAFAMPIGADWISSAMRRLRDYPEAALAQAARQGAGDNAGPSPEEGTPTASPPEPAPEVDGVLVDAAMRWIDGAIDGFASLGDLGGDKVRVYRGDVMSHEYRGFEAARAGLGEDFGELLTDVRTGLQPGKHGLVGIVGQTTRGGAQCMVAEAFDLATGSSVAVSQRFRTLFLWKQRIGRPEVLGPAEPLVSAPVKPA
jgi:hypothetical protein